MMRATHATIVCVVSGWAALSGVARASTAHWSEELTLSPRYAAEQPITATATSGLEKKWPEPGTVAQSNAFQDSKYKPAAPANSSGLDCSPVFIQAMAVEYRTRLGIGLGMATNKAWCVSQVVRLGTDAGLAIYHLRGIGNIYDEGARRAGVESTSNSNDRTIGVSFQLRF